ncbi:uncharacterized protein LOC134211066 [Armigeres subalbatus]|uniref:uncharacterized protein LOC134211066 n=1 Tax=Armigeres subalbatus TaxID=124917 RepID=UPI002ED065D9
MALFVLRSRYVAFPPLANIWLRNLLLVGHQKSTNVDAIDSFINELMENKAFKWKVLSNKHKPVPMVKRVDTQNHIQSLANYGLTQIYDDLTSNPLVINIKSLEQSHIDNLLDTAMRENNDKDVHLLFEQMIDYDRLPSKNVLNMLLEYFANAADRKRLDNLIALCNQIEPSFVTDGSGLLHYKAVIAWRGGNTFNSLDLFKKALIGCPTNETRKVINLLLARIVDETIGKKSEAVLLAVIEMGEFCMAEMKDDFLVGYIWERSFQSQWFSDQEAAKGLFDKHECLRLAVATRVNSLCFKFMHENDTEAVYRLMELLLKYGMSAQCRPILISLFEYQYWRRNLRACSEIMQNSLDLDIPLPESYNQKLLTLLLGRSSSSSAKPTTTVVATKQKQQPKTNKYQLKF